MRLRNVTTAIAASLSLIAAPVLAQAASPTATSAVRAGESTEDASNLNGEWIIPGLILVSVAFVLASIFIFDDDGSDSP